MKGISVWNQLNEFGDCIVSYITTCLLKRENTFSWIFWVKKKNGFNLPVLFFFNYKYWTKSRILLAQKKCHYGSRSLGHRKLIILNPESVKIIHALTEVRTLRMVSICHRLLGANFSATVIILDAVYCLNSISDLSRNVNNSFIMLLILLVLTRAKLNSIALLKKKQQQKKHKN